MDKYESTVHEVPYPIASVYAKLSDLRNVGLLKQQVNDPASVERVRSMGQVTDEQIAQMQRAVENMDCTPDSISVSGTPIGTVSLNVVERTLERCIKLQLEGAPMQANLWVQLLPVTETSCKMKCTLGADLNFFTRQMLKGKLQEGVEGVVKMLSSIPYGY